MTRTGICLTLACLLAACSSPEQGRETRAPLFEGLDGWSRRASDDADAQRYFDQGLMLVYGFNHDEAARSFEQAARLDPGCAMAWWGVAYALGPNINLPLKDEAVARRAYAAAMRAKELGLGAPAADRALIDAQALRYADPPPADRKALDLAYAGAMRAAWAAHPDDPDVGAVFADAMLNLRPWDQWTKDGRPNPGTEELIAALEKVLAREPEHPLAMHLYVHAIEASPEPGKALPVARRLDGRVPGAGHLLHMPAHIYLRTGLWADAVAANDRAIASDRRYFERVGPQGIYEAYKCHNHHFIVYASMFLGDRGTAMRAAREMVAEISPEARARLPHYFDCYLPQALHVMVRFGRWDEILDEPPFEARFPIAVATRHYARGVALANLDRAGEADQALADLRAAAAEVPEEARIVGTPARLVFEVAKAMLEGETLFRRGEHERAFEALRRAVALEDGLPYDEPPGWMQPVRHALGALLLQVGRVEEAEAAYREDLARHPRNGWSLHGLAECLRRRGDADAAGEAERAFAAAWARADGPIPASCFCRRL